MVNKKNMSENAVTVPKALAPVQPQKKPNETGSISVQGFVRIFDPNSKKVYVEKRA